MFVWLKWPRKINTRTHKRFLLCNSFAISSCSIFALFHELPGFYTLHLLIQIKFSLVLRFILIHIFRRVETVSLSLSHICAPALARSLYVHFNPIPTGGAIMAPPATNFALMPGEKMLHIWISGTLTFNPSDVLSQILEELAPSCNEIFPFR